MTEIINEKGRSMVEMLGVLAIVGVLSIGGVAAYTIAMNKYRTNELLDGASKRAITIATQLDLGAPVNLGEFSEYNATAGGTFQSNIEEWAKEFGIRVNEVNKATCVGLIKSIGRATALTAITTQADTSTPLATENCLDENNNLMMIYDRTLVGAFAVCKRKCGEQGILEFGIGTCKCGCFAADTPIMLANGTQKRADEVTYDDELLVWNFDEGRFDTAKPLWIKVPEVTDRYNYLRFSDGSVLKTIDQHRIFNREKGKFTYPMTDDTPVGTTTLNAKGEWVTLEEKAVIQEQVVFYNIITDYHINCFAGGVLTSNRFNNIYPIKDLKFVKDTRSLVPYSEYAELPRGWYDGLRLAEQPREVNRGNDVQHGRSIVDHIQRVYIAKAQIPQEKVA